MAQDTKAYLTLTPEAMEVLTKATTPRKRGEFVSKLLVQWGGVSVGVEQIDVEGLKLQMMGLASVNKSLESRVMNVEKQLAALIARR
jgi:predicted YcjX-like family ATPase